MTDFNEARIYVSTYGEYNNGSLFGDWYDLAVYNNAEELFKDVKKKHSGEQDPEFMVQDYEGFPKHMYGESMNVADLQKVYDYFKAIESVHEKDAFEVYINYMNITENFEDEVETFNCKYMGKFDSITDFAKNFIDECYSDEDIPQFIRYHIDFESMWYRSLQHDYTFINGYVFSDY